MAIINSCLVTSNEQEKTTASPKRTSGRFRLFEYSYDVPLLGTITIGCSKKGLRYLRSRHYKYLPEPANREELPLLREAAIEVTSYLKGELYSFADLPLDLKGTELQRAVWKHLMTIPRRETRTSTDLAQEMGKEKGIVMDGRDIGTTVFPDAELKVFVTASPEIRAQRRYEELKAKGQAASYEEILENVKQRDYIDQNREVSPLHKADDALLLDNSLLSIEQQKAWLMQQYERVVGLL